MAVKFVPPETINNFVGQIVSLCNPVQIFLFGSAAKRNKPFINDLDFLIVIDDEQPVRKVSQNLYNSIPRMGFSLDLIVVPTSELEASRDDFWSVTHYAITEGKVVYAKA